MEIETSSLVPTTVELDIERYAGMPEVAQQVMALVAMGFSLSSIAEFHKTSIANISQMIKRHDPEGRFHLTTKERRRFLAKIWEARALEALLYITPEKLKESNVMSLVRLAEAATRISSDIEPRTDEKQKSPDDILASMGKC